MLDLLFSYLIFNVHCLSAWWAQVDSNHRPCAYQAHALTTWAMSPYTLSNRALFLFPESPLSFQFSHLTFFIKKYIFNSILSFMIACSANCWWRWRGSNPWTPCLQSRCSPNWATPPFSPARSFRKNPENWTTNRLLQVYSSFLKSFYFTWYTLSHISVVIFSY